MKRRTLITIIIAASILAIIIIYSIFSGKEKAVILETEATRGRFEVAVMVTGELQALNQTEIRAPMQLRSHNLRIRSIKIQSLIPEGTVVDSGDWVATLDRSEADNSLKDIADELEKNESSLLRTKLDTTMQLRQLRDELINLRFNMEEAQITLEQSKYEPPATIRQTEINLEKASRAFDQATKNYVLKVQQAEADMREAAINLAKTQRQNDEMEAVLKQFDIRAPAPGMVIYQREWNGQKRTAGSEINTWDLTVATLPDLAVMISRTYVNEIDISKIKVGQRVNVGVDAFPEKNYSGLVFDVANIGEQLPNTDAKVFEVRIRVNEQDSILRPSMTTSNRIVTKVYDDVLFIPLEAVRTNDSLTYVFTRSGFRKVVVLGETNENAVIVEQGLEQGEKLYLSLPEDGETFRFTGLELMEVIKQKELEKEKEKEDEQMKEPPRQFNRQGQRPGGMERPRRSAE